VNSVILEFEEKVEEINEYFEFIKTTTHLRGFSENVDMIHVSQTVHNVLKANIFLLLYNLVESSFKNALENICIKITNDNLKYKDVIPEIKQMWIEKQYNNFEKIKNQQKSKFIMDKIDSITEDIIAIEFYSNDEKTKNDDISGNIDARAINKINAKYGARIENNPDIDTASLLTVKTNRNSLAHGYQTFSKCGRESPLPKLEDIKNDSIDYMRFILEHIQCFTDEQKYLLN
jgi:hypothetical protein